VRWRAVLLLLLLTAAPVRADEPPPPPPERRWYGGSILLAGLGWYLVASALTRNTGDPYKIMAVSLPALVIGPVVHGLHHEPRNLASSLKLDAVLLAIGSLSGLSLCAAFGSHEIGKCMAFGTVLSFVAPIWDGLVIAYRRQGDGTVILPSVQANALGLTLAGRF
jgi:hypothetical protein